MDGSVGVGTPEARDLLAVYELLSGYVSHGAMDTDDQFDGWFERMATLVPRRLVRPVDRVHRVVLVPARDLATIEAGDTLRLRPRAFGSWSRSPDAARRCLRGRFAGMADDMAALVLAKPVERDRVIVDVRMVYEALGFDAPTVGEWDLYASWEEEVIVRQHDAMLSVTAGDVTHAFLPGDVDALAPVVGEAAWSEFDGDAVAVERVHGSDDDGVSWDVTLVGGGRATVAWDGRHDGWDVLGVSPADDAGPGYGPSAR